MVVWRGAVLGGISRKDTLKYTPNEKRTRGGGMPSTEKPKRREQRLFNLHQRRQTTAERTGAGEGGLARSIFHRANRSYEKSAGSSNRKKVPETLSSAGAINSRLTSALRRRSAPRGKHEFCAAHTAYLPTLTHPPTYPPAAPRLSRESRSKEREPAQYGPSRRRFPRREVVVERQRAPVALSKAAAARPSRRGCRAGSHAARKRTIMRFD